MEWIGRGTHQSNEHIEEQTGYSNSPKFSVYRLNNPSVMKEGTQGIAVGGFED